MNAQNLAVTDVTQLVGDMEAGTFERRISVAISRTAAAVVDRQKPGKVTLTFEIEPVKGTQQVAIEHTVAYAHPTERGKVSETDGGETVFYVGRGGKVTISQQQLNLGQQASLT